MKALATLEVVAVIYVVGAVVHLVSFLVLTEARQKLQLDPPVSFYYTGRIETHGADEMAVFGAIFTSILSWVGVVFLVIPGAVWTVQEAIKRKRQTTKQG